MPNKQPALLPSPFEVLGQTWNIYKSRLATFLGIMLIPALLLAVVTLISAGVYMTNFTGGSHMLLVLFVLAVLLAFIITQIWSQVALLFAIRDSKENIDVITAYRRSWGSLLSYFWIVLLAGLAVTVGFILLIIPGVIFLVWFEFSVYVYISEGIKGAESLSRSKQLVKGRWPDVFVQILFISILIFVIHFIVQELIGKSLASLLANLFLTPLGATYLFVLYSHLRLNKNEPNTVTPEENPSQ